MDHPPHGHEETSTESQADAGLAIERRWGGRDWATWGDAARGVGDTRTSTTGPRGQETSTTILDWPKTTSGARSDTATMVVRMPTTMESRAGRSLRRWFASGAVGSAKANYDGAPGGTNNDGGSKPWRATRAPHLCPRHGLGRGFGGPVVGGGGRSGSGGSRGQGSVVHTNKRTSKSVSRILLARPPHTSSFSIKITKTKRAHQLKKKLKLK